MEQSATPLRSAAARGIGLIALRLRRPRPTDRPSQTVSTLIARALVPCAVRNAVVPPLVALLGAAALAACENEPAAARVMLLSGVAAMGRLLLEAAPPDARAAALAERDVCVRIPSRTQARCPPPPDASACAASEVEHTEELGQADDRHERAEAVAGEGAADSVGEGAGKGQAAIGGVAPRHVDAALQEGAPSEGGPEVEEIVFEGRLAELLQKSGACCKPHSAIGCDTIARGRRP